MNWYKISELRHQYAEWIWVWDVQAQRKLLVRYMGDETSWELDKDNSHFPVWSYLNG